jgi:hypothetical protein
VEMWMPARPKSAVGRVVTGPVAGVSVMGGS